MVQLNPSYKNNYTLSVTPFPDTDILKKKNTTLGFILTQRTPILQLKRWVYIYTHVHNKYLKPSNAFVAKVWKEIYSIHHTACSLFQKSFCFPEDTLGSITVS